MLNMQAFYQNFVKTQAKNTQRVPGVPRSSLQRGRVDNRIFIKQSLFSYRNPGGIEIVVDELNILFNLHKPIYGRVGNCSQLVDGFPLAHTYRQKQTNENWQNADDDEVDLDNSVVLLGFASLGHDCTFLLLFRDLCKINYKTHFLSTKLYNTYIIPHFT